MTTALLALLCLAAQEGAAVDAAPAPAALDQPAAPAPVPRLRVALQEPELDGVPARVGRVFATSLVRELRKLDRSTIVSMEEVRELLRQEANRQLVGCSDGGCLAEIADALGADELVLTRLSRVGDEHVLSVRRLSARAPDAGTSYQRRFAAKDGEEFLAAVGDTVVQLWPDRQLRPGERRGVDKEVARRLNPPPLGPVWFTLTTTAAELATTAGGAAGAGALLFHGQAQALLDESAQHEIDGRVIVENEATAGTLSVTSVGLLAGAAVAAAGSAVLFLFTDFDGAGRAAE